MQHSTSQSIINNKNLTKSTTTNYNSSKSIPKQQNTLKANSPAIDQSYKAKSKHPNSIKTKPNKSQTK